MRQTYQFILLLLTGIFFYSCQGDELSTQGSEGYLRVTLEQSAEVNTKADATYNSKQMRVVIKNAAGVTKYETNDHTELSGKEISLKQGEYTIEAALSHNKRHSHRYAQWSYPPKIVEVAT